MLNLRNPFESSLESRAREASRDMSDLLSRSWSRLPATAGVVVSTALLAGLTYAVWRAVRSTHQTRHEARPDRTPDDVTRWEGEGGGVPVGGSRMASDTTTQSTPASRLSPGPTSGGSLTH